MRLLCLCELLSDGVYKFRRMMYEKGHETVAVSGVETASAVPHLTMWADKIVLFSEDCKLLVPAIDKYKVVEGKEL